jgi:hypothetical protein
MRTECADGQTGQVTASAQVSGLPTDTITASDAARPSLAAPTLLPNRTRSPSIAEGHWLASVDADGAVPSDLVFRDAGAGQLRVRAAVDRTDGEPVGDVAQFTAVALLVFT